MPRKPTSKKIKARKEPQLTFKTTIKGGSTETIVNIAKAKDIVFPINHKQAVAVHQIGREPDDFTGRKSELEELYNKIKKGGVTISGIRGMGGIGKTFLALKLAHKLKPAFPDAQIFIDLKGDDEQSALSPNSIMLRVITSFYPDFELSERDWQLKDYYYSVLEGKKALILFDNALSERQVSSVLPPRTCALIVTSRQHFTLPGLDAKNIDTLSPDEAYELLLKITPRIRSKAREISKLCGYLPLALRLAANAFVSRPSLNPEAYLKDLLKEQERLKLIEASISVSYKMLYPEVQQLWRKLAVFRDFFTSTMVSSIWQISLDKTLIALDEMVSYSLVEIQEHTGFYKLHDLVRVFANAQLSDSERQVAWKHRTSKLTTPAFVQNRQEIIEGLGGRTKEAIDHIDDLKSKIYAAYIKKANDEKKEIHPAIYSLDNVSTYFSELVNIYIKRREEFKRNVGNDMPTNDAKQKFQSQPEIALLESTLQLLENFFEYIFASTIHLDLVGNIEIFEQRFESTMESILFHIDSTKEVIKN